MKVIDVKPFVVDCFRTNWVFIKVYTDEGIDGVGEATLEYKEKALQRWPQHLRFIGVRRGNRLVTRYFSKLRPP